MAHCDTINHSLRTHASPKTTVLRPFVSASKAAPIPSGATQQISDSVRSSLGSGTGDLIVTPPHEEQAIHGAELNDGIEATTSEVSDALMEDIMHSLHGISSGCDAENEEEPVRLAELWDAASRSRVVHAPEVDYYEELLFSLRRGDRLANLHTLSPFKTNAGPHKDSEDSFGINIPGTLIYFWCIRNVYLF